MSVVLRGQKYHYRFMVSGADHSGVCVGCTTKRQAEAYEARERSRALADAAEIRRNRTVRALVENYRYELTGGKPVTLAEAYELAASKPSKRESRSSHAAQRRSHWNDFSAFMRGEFPDVTEASAVRRTHCEAYVKHLVDHGRYDKRVAFRRSGEEVAYERSYLLSGKTIKEIAGTCRWVFSRIEEDAGLYRNPWDNVVLPAQKQVAREVFTMQELQLINDGIQSDPFMYVLFFVAANSGLPEGDICTLLWDDIDWANGFLRRDRRKTGTPIDCPLMPELEAFIQSQPRRGEYIFPEHAAMYLRQPSCVSERVASFLRRLGIKTTVELPGRRAVSVKDLHSMRHVFCYRAKKYGIPESMIQKIVGHKVLAMTQHYAAHDTSEELRREIKKLPPLFVRGAGVAEPVDAISSRRQLAELVHSLPQETVETLLSSLRAASQPAALPLH